MSLFVWWCPHTRSWACSVTTGDCSDEGSLVGEAFGFGPFDDVPDVARHVEQLFLDKLGELVEAARNDP